MAAIGQFFYAILYQPLLNVLVFLYNTIAFENFGLAIILCTILIRLVLFPIFQKSVRHQMIMQKVQPKLERIQREHKDDKEKQFKATMEVYKKHNINPFSGFLFLIIQLPVLIALYQIFLFKLTPETLRGLYPFVRAPQTLNTSFFGLINLEQGSIVVVALAALLQYLQIRLSLPKTEGKAQTPAERMSRQMMYIAPAITLIIFYRLPAAISLYWAVTSAFSIVQQYMVSRQLAHFNLDEKSGTIHKTAS